MLPAGSIAPAAHSETGEYVACVIREIFFICNRALLRNLSSHGHEEGVTHTFSGLYAGRRGRLWAGAQGAPQSAAALTKLRSALLKRTRGNREPCVVPDKLLQRIDVGTEGALVVSFSHSGHILAIAAKTNLPGVPLSSDSKSCWRLLADKVD
jgi:hypothetical protein